MFKHSLKYSDDFLNIRIMFKVSQEASDQIKHLVFSWSDHISF